MVGVLIEIEVVVAVLVAASTELAEFVVVLLAISTEFVVGV